jgi:hypothetical protein
LNAVFENWAARWTALTSAVPEQALLIAQKRKQHRGDAASIFF